MKLVLVKTGNGNLSFSVIASLPKASEAISVAVILPLEGGGLRWGFY
jgi:hypothetical protein